jgi:hypothetical protein
MAMGMLSDDERASVSPPQLIANASTFFCRSVCGTGMNSSLGKRRWRDRPFLPASSLGSATDRRQKSPRP